MLASPHQARPEPTDQVAAIRVYHGGLDKLLHTLQHPIGFGFSIGLGIFLAWLVLGLVVGLLCLALGIFSAATSHH